MKTISALLTTSALLSFASAQAATLTWDPLLTGSSTGGGTGTWNTANTNWYNGTSDVAWTDTTGLDIAVFGNAATGATVTLGNALTLNGLLFNSSNYTLTAAASTTLTLAGASPGITVTNVADTAVIGSNVVLAGSAGLTKSGAGTLTINTAGTYTGGTTISAGRVNIGVANALGNTAGAVTVASGATLDLAGFSLGNNVTIAGTGTAAQGALYNSSSSAISTIGILTLSADSTIGGAVNNNTGVALGVTAIDLAGKTLSINSGRLLLDSSDSMTGGNIVINNGGVIYMGNSSTAGAGSGVTITIKSGGTFDARDYVNSGLAFAPALVLDGGTISNGLLGSNGGGVGANLFNNVQVTANGGTLNGSGTAFGIYLRLSGALTGSGALTLAGGKGVEFQGDTSAYTGTATSSAGTVSFNPSAGNQVFKGTLAGTQPVVKNGTNTTWLLGSNTYTGKTTIAAGTLGVTSINKTTSPLASSSLGAPTTVANGTIAIGATTTGGTLRYIGTGETTDRVIDLSGTTGGATLTQDGSGLLKFTSALTATGAGAKTLTLSGMGSGELAGAVIDNSVTNTTSVTKSGSGTWTLSGTNTYTGATAVNTGTLNLTGSLASAVTVASGALISGTGSTTGNLTFNAGSGIAVTNGGAGIQSTGVTTVNASTNIYVTGTPSGTAATATVVRYAGATPGTANFSAATNYRGGSLTDTGTAIQLGYTAEAKTWNNTAGGTWDIGTSTPWAGTADSLFFWGDSVNFGATAANQTVTLTGNLAPSSISVSNAANTYTFSGAGAIVGAGSLTMSGAGDLTMNATTANTYAGGTTVSAGRVRVAGGSALGSGAVTVSGSGGSGGQVYATAGTYANTFVISGFGGNAIDSVQRGALRIDGATVSGNIILAGDTAIDVNSGTGTISGSIIGSSNLTVGYGTGDTGTLYLTGANAMSGTLTVNRGTLQVGAAQALGLAQVTVNSGALLRYSTGAASSYTSSSHRITLNDGASLSLQGGGASVITVSDNIVLNSPTTAAKIGGFLYGNSAVYSGTISGTGPLQITGFDGGSNGAIFRNGWTMNSYSGNTSITGLGSLTFDSGNVVNNARYTPFGTGTATLTNQTVIFNAPSTANAYYIDNGFSLVSSGTGSTVLQFQDAVAHVTGNIAVSQSGTGNVNIRSYWSGGKDPFIDGVISGTGNLAFSSGNNTGTKIHLTNTGNTFSGTYLLDASGGQTATLQLNADGAAQFAKLNLSVAAARVLINTSNATIAGLTGVATSDISATGGSRTLTINNTTADTYAGTLGANGATLAIIKNGSGSLTLTGTNTFSGGTTINAGTVVTGNTAALGAGNVTLAGGTLQIGNGTTQTVTLSAAKNITATAAATLAFNGVTSAITLSGGGKYDFTGQTMTLNLNNAFNAVNTYTLISGGTGNLDAAAYSFSNVNTGSFSYAFANGVLTVTAIPEPSTYGLLGAGALAGITMIRRRRKQAR